MKVDNVDLNTRYDPHVLPDYGGPFFQHVKAKLVQQDIRDVKGKLIPPTKWCETLRPGSLVVATVEPHVSIMPDERRPGELKKVRFLTITIPFYSLFKFSPQFYQLTARRVKVIDSSDVTIPHHPQAASTRKFKHQTSPTDADKDFDNFFVKRFKEDKNDKGEGTSKGPTTNASRKPVNRG